jgi:putative chitinase
MSVITPQLLRAAMPYATAANCAAFSGPLDAACERYSIVGRTRLSCFLAQVCHESGSLRYVRELADGSAYEGRKDLGNFQPGDGVRYKGRGLIQITGRANYAKCGAALGLPLIDHPELLEQPEHAAMSAGWFWDTRHLNDIADAGDFTLLTRRINGGLNGLAQREEAYDCARKALACTANGSA